MIKSVLKFSLSLSLFMVVSANIHSNENANQKTLRLLAAKSGALGWAGGPLNPKFLKEIHDQFDVELFIETGTYIGDSTAIAAEIFGKTYSIELSASLYEGACKRFINTTNVCLFLGDSSKVLPSIFESTKTKAALWLDGHWSQGGTARGNANTPILEELNALNNSSIKNNILLIDDIRLFQRPSTAVNDIALQGYPDLNDIIDIIHQINHEYKCWVYGDILIAFTDTNVSVSPFIESLTISRLNKADEPILEEAEKIIANANAEEEEMLRGLYTNFSNTEICFTNYFNFWYALIIQKNDPQLAYGIMKLAADGGCTRAQHYLSRWNLFQN